jgi:hypothetical protein
MKRNMFPQNSHECARKGTRSVNYEQSILYEFMKVLQWNQLLCKINIF